MLVAHKCVLAGGALTSILTKQPVNDLDIYFKDEKYLVYSLLDIINHKDKIPYNENDDLLDILGEQYLNSFDLVHICKTDKSISFLQRNTDVKIQFIYQNYYENTKDIFKDFDFTINMVAYDFEKDELVCDEMSLLHLSQRILVTNGGTKYPLISVLRTNKYQERGYSISKKEMVKLLLAVNSLKIDSYEDVAKHVGGLYGNLDVTKIFNPHIPFSLENTIEQLTNLDTDIETERKYNCLYKVIYEFITKDCNLPYVLPLNPEYPVGEHFQKYHPQNKVVISENIKTKLNSVKFMSNSLTEYRNNYSGVLCFAEVVPLDSTIDCSNHCIGTGNFVNVKNIFKGSIDEYFQHLMDNYNVPEKTIDNLKLLL